MTTVLVLDKYQSFIYNSLRYIFSVERNVPKIINRDDVETSAIWWIAVGK